MVVPERLSPEAWAARYGRGMEVPR
jgi:hypothetical protein